MAGDSEVAKALDKALDFVPAIFGGDKNTVIFFTIVFVFILMYAILLAVFSTPIFKHLFQSGTGSATGLNKQAKVVAFSLAGIAILALFVTNTVGELTNQITGLLASLKLSLVLLLTTGGFFLIFFLFQAFEPKGEDKAGLASFLGAVFAISFLIINTGELPIVKGFAMLALIAVLFIGGLVKLGGHESPTIPRPGFGGVDKTLANNLLEAVKRARVDKEGIAGHPVANQNIFNTLIAKIDRYEERLSRTTRAVEISLLEQKLRDLKSEIRRFTWA